MLMTIADAFWPEIAAGLRPEQISRRPSDCLAYSYDNGRHRSIAQAIIWAETLEQVQHVVKTCYQHHVCLTARGRGTGTPGGAIASPGGIILSLERMTQIVDFNPSNRSVRVECGVLNQTVQDIAADAQLFWPPDPSSAAFCTIGGNLAYNSGGPRAVKYGSTRDHVLAITAVTGTGDCLHTGFAAAKTACGYDLTRLLIGSEGTLAVIVDATLKLSPMQPASATLQAWFSDSQAIAAVVPALLACPAQACAIEYLDHACLTILRQQAHVVIPQGAQALLMIEIDGLASALDEAICLVQAICQQHACLKLDSALTDTDRQRLWATRKALSPALRHIAHHKINEDIVVPIHQLTALFTHLDRLAQQYAFTMVNFGHIGSGNLHVNVLLPTLTPAIEQQVEAYLAELFHIVLSLGGALSGEHGIGLDKKPYLAQAISPQALQLMHAIKQQFDPRGILNPDKLLPTLY